MSAHQRNNYYLDIQENDGSQPSSGQAASPVSLEPSKQNTNQSSAGRQDNSIEAPIIQEEVKANTVDVPPQLIAPDPDLENVYHLDLRVEQHPIIKTEVSPNQTKEKGLKLEFHSESIQRYSTNVVQPFENSQIQTFNQLPVLVQSETSLVPTQQSSVTGQGAQHNVNSQIDLAKMFNERKKNLESVKRQSTPQKYQSPRQNSSGRQASTTRSSNRKKSQQTKKQPQQKATFLKKKTESGKYTTPVTKKRNDDLRQEVLLANFKTSISPTGDEYSEIADIHQYQTQPKQILSNHERNQSAQISQNYPTLMSESQFERASSSSNKKSQVQNSNSTATHSMWMNSYIKRAQVLNQQVSITSTPSALETTNHRRANSISDRLFHLSKEYDQKKQIAIKVSEHQRDQEINQSMKSSSKKRKLSNHDVENRLIKSGQKSNQKIDHLKQQIQNNEIRNLQEKPSINKNAKHILNAMDERILKMKVEDRLTQLGKLREKIVDVKRKVQEEQYVKKSPVKMTHQRNQTFIAKQQMHLKNVQNKINYFSKQKKEAFTYKPKVNKEYNDRIECKRARSMQTIREDTQESTQNSMAQFGVIYNPEVQIIHNRKPTSKNEIRNQLESIKKLSQQRQVPKPSPVVVFQKKKINPEVWENLFQHSQIKQHQQIQNQMVQQTIFEESQENLDNEEDEGQVQKPFVIKPKQTKSLRRSKSVASVSHISKIQSNLDRAIYDKNQKWLRHKERSRKRGEEIEKKKMKKVCPFKPEITPMEINKSDMQYLTLKNPSIKSIQTYINQQNKIKSKKQQRQLELDQRPGNGQIWTGELTKSSRPKFATEKRRQSEFYKSKNQLIRSQQLQMCSRSLSSKKGKFPMRLYPSSINSSRVEFNVTDPKNLSPKKNNSDFALTNQRFTPTIKDQSYFSVRQK